MKNNWQSIFIKLTLSINIVEYRFYQPPVNATVKVNLTMRPMTLYFSQGSFPFQVASPFNSFLEASCC